MQNISNLLKKLLNKNIQKKKRKQCDGLDPYFDGGPLTYKRVVPMILPIAGQRAGGPISGAEGKI